MKKIFLLLSAIAYISTASGMENSWGFGSGPDLLLNAGWRLLCAGKETFDSANCARRVNASTGITVPLMLSAMEKLCLELGEAAQWGDCSLVERYLKEGADANKEYYCTGTPLIRAVSDTKAFDHSLTDTFKNKRKACEMLIKAGADVNAKSAKDGQTALMKAIQCLRKIFPRHIPHHCLDIIKLLIAKGADVYAIDDQGFSALDYATNLNLPEICDYLVNNSAKKVAAKSPDQQIAHAFINASNGIGATALHYAALKGNLAICELLLKNGADVNKATYNAEYKKLLTPLHIAAASNHKEIYELLLKHGADETALNDDDHSLPRDLIVWDLPTCSICLDPIQGERRIVRNCNHIFHDKCIMSWYHEKKYGKMLSIAKCPNCNGDLKKMHLVYDNPLETLNSNKQLTPLMLAAAAGDLKTASDLIK